MHRISRRLVALAVAAALAPACANSEAERKKELQQKAGTVQAEMAAEMAEAARQAAQRLQQAKDAADAQCNALSGKPVSPAEEHGVGEAVASTLTKPGPAPNEKLAAYVQKVGTQVAAHAKRSPGTWTFTLLEDPQPKLSSTVGGYVFISTGAIGKLKNEAQLAGLLAHEVVHVSDDWLARYDEARVSMCKVALTGLALTESGASDVPGGDAFVKNSKFERSMKKFGDPNGLNFDGDDADFLSWYAGRFMAFQQLKAFDPDEELKADAQAVELIQKAGYDTGALGLALAAFDEVKNASRVDALKKNKPKKGKTPPFPKDVPLPR